MNAKTDSRLLDEISKRHGVDTKSHQRLSQMHKDRKELLRMVDVEKRDFELVSQSYVEAEKRAEAAEHQITVLKGSEDLAAKQALKAEATIKAIGDAVNNHECLCMHREDCTCYSELYGGLQSILNRGK